MTALSKIERGKAGRYRWRHTLLNGGSWSRWYVSRNADGPRLRLVEGGA